MGQQEERECVRCQKAEPFRHTGGGHKLLVSHKCSGREWSPQRWQTLPQGWEMRLRHDSSLLGLEVGITVVGNTMFKALDFNTPDAKTSKIKLANFDSDDCA